MLSDERVDEKRRRRVRRPCTTGLDESVKWCDKRRKISVKANRRDRECYMVGLVALKDHL